MTPDRMPLNLVSPNYPSERVRVQPLDRSLNGVYEEIGHSYELRAIDSLECRYLRKVKDDGEAAIYRDEATGNYYRVRLI